MEYSNDFKYDLKVGQVGEQMLAKILTDAKIEVKRDSWICRSGNIAIEFESRGNPSGISTTQADWWCFIVSGKIDDKVMVLIETNKLKEIARKYYLDGCIKKMGDNNTSTSILIPYAEIIKDYPSNKKSIIEDKEKEISILKAENDFLKQIISKCYDASITNR